jgi:3-polyprenyl-4-hydroxybenzoate decarboxylase
MLQVNDKDHRTITDLMAKIGSQKLVRNNSSSAKRFDSNSPEYKQLVELESFQHQSFDESKVSQSRADLTRIPNCLCPKNDIAKYIDSKWKVDKSLSATTL